MKRLTWWHAEDLLVNTAYVFGAFILSYFVVWAVVEPLQNWLLPGAEIFASILFLPHGVRVLATTVLRGRAVPGLMLGELAGNFAFWNLPSWHVLVILSLASGILTWVVFEGLRALRIHPYYLQLAACPPTTQTLILAGVAAAAANSFALTALIESTLGTGRVMPVLAAFLAGDILGLLAFLLVARVVTRLVR